MLRKCVTLAILGCVLAAPQHQYQAQPQQHGEGIPPHLLRQYLADQGGAQTHTISRPTHIAPAPARIPYAVQSEPQYQQQAQYQPQPQPQPQAQPQPQYRQQYQPQRAEPQQPQEEYDPHPSYQFGFDVNDDQYTNYQNRKEQRDGDVIKGSYSVVDSDGFIRTVTYTADPKEGFKAEVQRQPTDIVVKIPTPKPQIAQQPQLAHQPQISHQPQIGHQQQIGHQSRPQQPPPQYYHYEQ
ncbi:cuticular protein RR-2 motif 78 precursor [Bombyx mori]|uniref:Putative cuticle protein n=1 Tax=Bombyx mori TaxID=7091 RepID=C0H6S0_BOMMO|nr:cuticular protein RR-2 motif 78 precursor [Bombyx mori]FAA00581.1 TPA: putative cuticle protein [Bombyx mori]